MSNKKEEEEEKKSKRIAIFFIIVFVLLTIGIIVTAIVLACINVKDNNPIVLSGNCSGLPPNPILCNADNLYFMCTDTNFLYLCNFTCPCWVLQTGTTTTEVTTETTTTTTTTEMPVTTTTTEIATTTPPVFSISCPSTYVGPIVFTSTQINDLTITGNATYVADAPCANLTLSYSDNPVVGGFFKRQVLNDIMGNLTSRPPMYPLPNVTRPSVGVLNMGGHVVSVRSVTSPLDFSAFVGIFNTTYSFTTNFNTAFRMGYAFLGTNGVYRYFTNVGMEMTKVVQHDYYSLTSNFMEINVGEIFSPSSPCYMHSSWTNTSHYPRAMKYSKTYNRLTILYAPIDTNDNATVFCLVASNTPNLFTGGAYGYEIPLAYPVIGLTRLDLGVYRIHYKISFDALGGTQAGGVNVGRYANIYYLNATAIFNTEPVINMCNYDQSIRNGQQDYSISPVHDNGMCERTDFLSSMFIGIDSFGYTFQVNLMDDFSTCTFNAFGQGNGYFSSPIPVSGLNIATGTTILSGNGVTTLDAGARAIQSACGLGTRFSGIMTYNLDPGSGNSGIVIFGNNAVFTVNYPDYNLFGGSIVLNELISDAGLWVGFYQTSNVSGTSTNYRYLYQSLRDIVINRTFNGVISQPAQMTLIDNVNLISVGMDVVPNKYETTIYGMSNSSVPGVFQMTNQDLIMMGENVTRTFTLSDSCQSVSCTQQILLQTTPYTGPT